MKHGFQLAFQVVEILWTKASRGAPRANERAGLSRAFPIETADEARLVQHFRMNESEGFAVTSLPLNSKEALPAISGVLELVELGSGQHDLKVFGTPSLGQPRRKPLPQPIRLLPGRYVQLLTNARHTSYSGQYYSETVFNIASGMALAPDRFVRAAPDHRVDLRAHLF